jgi:beige protein homolog 1
MSQSLAGRHRAPSTVNEHVASDLHALTELVDTKPSQSAIHALCDSNILKRLRHSLIDQSDSARAKDTFRSLSGFQTLLRALRLLSSFYEAEEQPPEAWNNLLVLLKDFFWVLVEALRHNGNRRYFAKRVEGGGWKALEDAIKKVYQLSMLAGEEQTQFYGCLFAASIGDEAFSDIFTTILKSWDAEKEVSREPRVAWINRHKALSLPADEILENPEIANLIISLWLDDNQPHEDSPLRLSILVAVTRIISSSRRNLIGLHSTGSLSLILPRLFDDSRPSGETALLHILADTLSEQGLNNLDDARNLSRKAASSNDASTFLLNALRRSKSPPSIQFDLSLHGYASVELPTLGRTFPPSSGYTVSLWFKVDSFDVQAHTTLFGAFDASQTCFVLVYLEKDTQYMILQTSVKSARPSVRFKSIKFEAGRWYHVCLVHKKPRTMASPRASLFVDGELVEQMKAQYPPNPIAMQNQKEPRVQTFLGTPQDLAARVGKGVSTSKWSLASANLFEDPVGDDLIAVWFNLGPRYHGNFQDCLGSFLSYRSSAALNLRNENLHPGKEDQSEIVAAIRQKASKLFPESRTLLSISPSTVMDNDDRNDINESQLIKSLSKDAAKNLQYFTRSGGNAIAINGAVPAINDALIQSHGIGILTGEPVVSVPQSLDDASWRAGGCSSLGLYLLDAARTKEGVIMAVEILFETVRDNWRNSEAMERENGYGVLASLLRDKLGFTGNGASKLSSTIDGDVRHRNDLALKLLRLILEFVGYNSEDPTKSIINNPLAYRVLLVDLDVWRFAALPVQRAYYEQFNTFGLDSSFHRFNSKRLSRMRIAKKLLNALKGELFSADVLPSFMKAFKTLISCSMSAEVLRSLALFVTYAVHHGEGLHRSKSRMATKSVRPRSTRNTPEPSEGFLSKAQLGIEVLKMFCDLLCDDDTGIVKKFARTVTNKWLLYLMSEDDSEVVVLAAKILARLLFVHGTSYVKKFAEKTNGFAIMRHQLKRWWHVPSLWPVCFSILFGYDVGKLDLERSFDLFGFLDLFAGQAEVNVVCPDVLTVIAGMIQAGLKIVNGKAAQERRPKPLQNATHLRSRSMSLTKSPSTFDLPIKMTTTNDP